MAVLGDRKIEIVTLPFSGAQVKMRSRLTTAEMTSLYEGRGSELESLIKTLADVIVEWDFTEEDGSPVEITPAAINRIDGEDFTALTAGIKGFAEQLEQRQVGSDEKKV